MLLVQGLWMAPSALAQQSDCPPPRPALDVAQLKAQARDRGLLWRLDKGGRTSWLYGTVHAARVDWVMPGPTIVQAVAASDVVAVELDLSDPSTLEVLSRPADPAVAQRVLDDGRRQRLQRLRARSCAPQALVERMRPLMQVMTISVLEAGRWGYHADLSVDAMLMGMARASGKRLVALETAAQQLAALTPASEEDERQLVDRSLQVMEAGGLRQRMDKIMRVWAEGDEAQLARYEQWCECMDTPAERRFTARINDERNPAMADKLAALHDGGARVFAGVGLLHMAGPQSLLTLLRARGFAVERVRFPTPPQAKP